MLPAFPPLAILLDKGAAIYAIDFGRYLAAAGVVSAVVWGMRHGRHAGRRIQAREASDADRRREFLQSVQTVGVYTLVSCFIVWGVELGLLHRFKGSYGLASDLLLLAAVILAHDAYFYWAHRAMHHPRLFKTFHQAHHRSVTPTPWAAYSFAPPEAFVMIAFVPLWLAIVPTPARVMVMWLGFQILRNAIGHAGFELHPRWWLANPLTRWISTTTHHDLHHAGGFNTNYGLYFTWWDKWMGTENPRYAETFAQVVGEMPRRAKAADGEQASAIG
jgi:sterol desaturase/sphingolipid hydroxylase (fatty acid hydroxylase superfamily)